VRFHFHGQHHTENFAPYSLAGDTNGAFHPAHLPVGTHSVTVTAYPQPNAGGTPITSTTLSFSIVDNPINSPPVLITEENTDRAIAVNAATLLPGPFDLFTEHNFAPDNRTRIILFATDIQPSPGATMHAESPSFGSIPMPIEFIGAVPNFPWLIQIKVRLPEELANAGDVWLRLSSNGKSSNQARISITQSTAAATMPPSLLKLLAHSWIRPDPRVPRRLR
jgi:uncharacterized protein (TIGR03437 family)